MLINFLEPQQLVVHNNSLSVCRPLSVSDIHSPVSDKRRLGGKRCRDLIGVKLSLVTSDYSQWSAGQLALVAEPKTGCRVSSEWLLVASERQQDRES